jgi:lipopolysaccharide export system protein LptA
VRFLAIARNNKKNKKYVFFIFFSIFLNCLFAQNRPPIQNPVASSNVIDIDNSDSLRVLNQKGIETRILSGNVKLHQGTTNIFCDSAVMQATSVHAFGNVIVQQGDTVSLFAKEALYEGLQRTADVQGDVVLVNGKQQLFTDKLKYDLPTKTARYTTGALLTDGTVQMRSRRGVYNAQNKKAYFQDSVTMIDPKFSLRTDSMQFNTETQLAEFVAPTLINQNGGKIYCEGGFYDLAKRKAEFTKNPQYQKDSQKAWANTIRYGGENGEIVLDGDAHFEEKDRRATADRIRYDETNNFTYLEGHAKYKDDKQNVASDEIKYDRKRESFSTKGRSTVTDKAQILTADALDYDSEKGAGVANGNVVWNDTINKLIIKSEALAYNKKTDYVRATGKKRPMLLNVTEKDTLFMTAESIIGRKKSEKDSSRILLAYSDVRIFKKDLQAVCDSLTYSAADSAFQLYKNPLIWSDTTQFSADTIFIRSKSNKIDKIFLYNNAFVINSPDDIFYNQIKGKYITAHFLEGKMKRVNVDGNAEAIYYAIDKNKAYVGANKTVGSEMVLFFGNNRMERIKFLKPDGKITPMRQVKDNQNEFRLKGFDWNTKKRPTKLEDLW